MGWGDIDERGSQLVVLQLLSGSRVKVEVVLREK